MKFTTAIISSTLIAASAAVPLRLVERAVAFDASLVPLLGFHSGVNPTGTGDCDGAVKGSNGQPIKVPCACPPDQDTFNQAVDTNVQAGFAVHNPSVKVSFPLDSSTNSQITRVQAALVTLQNLNGPGQGCPAASTTLSSQLSALQNPGSAPAPAPAKSSAAPAQTTAAAASSPAAPASGSVPFDASLVPSLGFTSGKNPTGTGDCDGAVNGADGKPIKIPCACPPDQTTFNQAVDANVQAGFAVHNPSVKVSFPLDSSTNSQITRVQAAIVTLQNLNGPGQGCPAASTTFSAQLSALQNPQSAPAAAPPQNVAVAASSTKSTVAAASSSPAAASAPAGAVPFDASLVPALGFTAGKNPTGTGNCDGAVNGADGKPIEVPCACPPDQTTFNQAVDANVQAGFAVHNPSVKVSFPLDSSTNSQITRVQAAIVTLQNLNGPGQGCPAASTTFSAQLSALQNPQAAKAAAPAQAASSSAPAATVASAITTAAAPAETTDTSDDSENSDCPSAVTVTVTEEAEPTEAASNSAATSAAPAITSSAAAASSTASSSSSSSSATFGGLTLSQIDALTPQFGHASGVNPTGTGNCDGAVNGSDGKPIQVPCSCPPARAQFIQSLADDISAGHAVHNPTVGVQFPTDNSAASQRTRIQAALVALQNLNGSGVGCPASSTTFLAQLNAIQG